MTSRREAVQKALEAGVAARAGMTADEDKAEFIDAFERVLREHGWVLVPAKWPTDAMIQAGTDAWDKWASKPIDESPDAEGVIDIYIAMRDASESESQ